MQANAEKVVVANPLSANTQQWMFEKQAVENRTPREIIQTLHNSGELAGDRQEWKLSYQGKQLHEDRPLHQQMAFSGPETRLYVHPIVAGAQNA